MGWRRRKAPAPAGPTLAELLAPWNDATYPVLTRTTRMERALVSLATHTAQLRKRVETMEQRVDGRELMMSSAPSRADIDEIREQSARLAHDLARLSIDLREELARAVDAVRLAQTNSNANGNAIGHAERRHRPCRGHRRRRVCRHLASRPGRDAGHRPHRGQAHLPVTPLLLAVSGLCDPLAPRKPAGGYAEATEVVVELVAVVEVVVAPSASCPAASAASATRSRASSIASW